MRSIDREDQEKSTFFHLPDEPKQVKQRSIMTAGNNKHRSVTLVKRGRTSNNASRQKFTAHHKSNLI